jgi:hypothetical protein
LLKNEPNNAWTVQKKLFVSAIATVAVGGLTWLSAKDAKKTVTAGLAAFVASYVLSK